MITGTPIYPGAPALPAGALDPLFAGLSYGFIATTGYFCSNTSKVTCLTLYAVKANHSYVCGVRGTVSNRLRVHLYYGRTLADFLPYLTEPRVYVNIYTCDVNVTGTTDLSGDQLLERVLVNPSADGVLIVTTSYEAVLAPAFAFDFSGKGAVYVDQDLSAVSANPVQNRAVAAALTRLELTFDEAFIGQSCTITGGNGSAPSGESYTVTVPASGTLTQPVHALETCYTVSCTSANSVTRTITVTTGSYVGIYHGVVNEFQASLTVTAPAGAYVTAVRLGAQTGGTADAGGTVTLTLRRTGETTVMAFQNGQCASATVTADTDGGAYTADLSSISGAIPSWASGSEAQIASVVLALDAGALTAAQTGWAVGNTRSVPLAAMAATGVGESHAAQTVKLTLMDSGHYDLVSGGKDHFVVGMQNALNEEGYIHSAASNAVTWDSCARRAWCNGVFRAAVPETLRACFKKFRTIAASAHGGTGTTASEDFFALFAEKEVFGTRRSANAAEADELTQISYYAASTNRVKYKSSGSMLGSGWWLRSLHDSASIAGAWLNVNNNAQLGGTQLNSTAFSLSPFGCI